MINVEEFSAKVREAILAQQDKIELVSCNWGETAADYSDDIECGCPLMFLIRHLLGAEFVYNLVIDLVSEIKTNEDLVFVLGKEGIHISSDNMFSFYRGFDNVYDDKEDIVNDWFIAGNKIRQEFLSK